MPSSLSKSPRVPLVRALALGHASLTSRAVRRSCSGATMSLALEAIFSAFGPPADEWRGRRPISTRDAHASDGAWAESGYVWTDQRRIVRLVLLHRHMDRPRARRR